MGDANQLAPSVALLHLTVDQAWFHRSPAHLPPSPIHLELVSKLSGQGIKVEIQAITEEEWETVRGQEVFQGVDDVMCCVLRAGCAGYFDYPFYKIRC